jgi:hypothetical protein
MMEPPTWGIGMILDLLGRLRALDLENQWLDA